MTDCDEPDCGDAGVADAQAADGDTPSRCDDGIRNGAESDVDCGGSCPPCAPGQSCATHEDCSTNGCVEAVCRIGPTAGFTLSPDRGTAPLLVAAASDAAAGEAPIALVEYDFGAGYSSGPVAGFPLGGTFEVRQRVTDESGLVDTASRTIDVDAPAFDCRLSATDKSDDEVVTLTPDRLAAEWHSGHLGGVRSECAATARSGVYYFEASLEPYECDPSEAPLGCVPTPRGRLNIGVGPMTTRMTDYPGLTREGFDILISGGVYGGEFLGAFPFWAGNTWGFVVDYRGAAPTIHLIGENGDGPSVLWTRALTTSAPLHAMATGSRRKVGVDLSFNFGIDTNNAPFAFDVGAVLRAEELDDVADALVLGWTGTQVFPSNERPTLAPPADTSVALGTAVTLRASASDPEEGEVSERIVWEDLATVYGSRDGARGDTFVFTPRSIGLHPIRATITDSFGARRQAIIRVEVTGALPMHAPVRLDGDDPFAGSGVDLSTDGLTVQWTEPQKMGIRANQGLYGDFWYFEATRLGRPVNQGAGLVIAEGTLDPYQEETVPPSYSINTLTGTWQNLIHRGDYPITHDAYGFAVDYRDINPVVYFIVGDEVADVWTMYDAFLPVHPMLYGNPTGDRAPWDIRANFGATPFSQNPCRALADYGVPVATMADLRVGWGVHAMSGCR